MYQTLGLLAAVAAAGLLYWGVRTFMIIRRYSPPIRRIFDESPIFAPTEGVPHPAAEEVEFQTPEGLTLRGSYISAASKPRGIVVFCHEFLSDRWSGVAYWEPLQESFDIFAFDFRSHGDSDKDPAYTPRHWVTNYEEDDLEAAIAYLGTRPGTANLPIGLFGISRGGGTAVAVAARHSSVRCVLTDGAFGTHGTMLTYMKKWITLVVGDKWWLKYVPDWYLAFIRDRVLSRIERDYGCKFLRLERAIRRLAPRPILMIHGGRDSYIRPDIAREFHACARDPKDLWIVPGARHNACLETAGEQYRSRIRDFFEQSLYDAASAG